MNISRTTLGEYAWLVAAIRRNKAVNETDIKAAVNKALEEMPKDFLIRDFLMAHRKEVEGMLDTEYNEAEVKELFVADGIRKTVATLRKHGIDDQTIVIDLCEQYSLSEDEAKKYM